MWMGPDDPPLVGMGCMRLSADPGRDEEAAVETVRAGLEAGVTLIDTADAYGLDDREAGHNERLIARALARFRGDRSRIRIATKGGLTRPGGAWVPDGRARHLAAACDASRRALGVERLDLYQLHAPDPRVPLGTSVRALAALRRDGLVGAVGLCNVTLRQLEEARRIVDVAAVQVEMSVWQDGNVVNGVAPYCVAQGIHLLAYRPLGGVRGARRIAVDPVLVDIASRYGATPHEVALAWLAGLSRLIVPLPGPTRAATARSGVRARTIVLDPEDLALLDERFPAGRAFRPGERPARRPARGPAAGEVVLVMGLPAAGKSTVAGSLVARGYTRINRDEAGGTLAGLVPRVDRLIASGTSRLVLDNTYTTRKSRAPVVDAAARHGLPVRCVWLKTGLDDAQVNAAWRMVSRHGRLLTPDEMRRSPRSDPSMFGPAVQFRHARALEPPDASEGFSAIETVPFERAREPDFTNRALIVWCDDVLARSRSGRRTPVSPEDLVTVEEHGRVLRRWADRGWLVLGLSWQPDIDGGGVPSSDVEAVFDRIREGLGVPIEIEYCPHGAGPPVCWCRKPLPGLGVVFIQRHRLDPARCIYVGAGSQDRAFARRLGFRYADAAEVFGPEGSAQA